MIHHLYIARDRSGYPVYGGNNHAALPPILITLEDTLRLSVAFGEGGVIAGLGSATGRLVIKAADAPDGEVLVTDTAFNESGSGAATRYAFSVAVDGDALRVKLGRLIESTLTAQIEWTIASEVFHSASFPVTVLNAVARVGDDFPDSALDARWAWLKARLVAGDACSLSYDEGAQTITVDLTSDVVSADDGWSPEYAVVADGARRVLQITGWVGGSGSPPASPRYVGASGLTTVLASAIDIRGSTGATGPQGTQGEQGIQGEVGPSGGEPGAPGAPGASGTRGWQPALALVIDGDRCVLQLVAWVGGEGSTPTDFINYYVGSAGLVSDIASATDIRGAVGAAGADGTIIDLDTSYTAWTGTADKTSKATYTAPDISATYVEAEIQAMADAIEDNSRLLKALLDSFLAGQLPSA